VGPLVYFDEWESERKGMRSCVKARVSFTHSKPKQQASEGTSLKYNLFFFFNEAIRP